MYGYWKAAYNLQMSTKFKKEVFLVPTLATWRPRLHEKLFLFTSDHVGVFLLDYDEHAIEQLAISVVALQTLPVAAQIIGWHGLVAGYQVFFLLLIVWYLFSRLIKFINTIYCFVRNLLQFKCSCPRRWWIWTFWFYFCQSQCLRPPRPRQSCLLTRQSPWWLPRPQQELRQPSKKIFLGLLLFILLGVI